MRVIKASLLKQKVENCVSTSVLMTSLKLNSVELLPVDVQQIFLSFFARPFFTKRVKRNFLSLDLLTDLLLRTSSISSVFVKNIKEGENESQWTSSTSHLSSSGVKYLLISSITNNCCSEKNVLSFSKTSFPKTSPNSYVKRFLSLL